MAQKIGIWLLAFSSGLSIIVPAARGEDVEQSRNSGRQGKLLSLFTVINFQNSPCGSNSEISSASTPYRQGTCYTSSECFSKGGSSKGSCASGFGVCCVFILSKDGQTTVSYNNTYIQNNGYPGVLSASNSISYTVNKCSSSVCFLRLDFETFSIRGPVNSLEADAEKGGACTDVFKVTTSSGQKVPDICGKNSGQHIYLSIGSGASDTATLSFTFNGVDNSRKWEIKVAQIPCGNYAPSDGCLQYFFGVQGKIRTFNFEPTAGSSHLGTQQYTTCIRQEQGFCCVEYTVCTDDNSFSLNRLNDLPGKAVQDTSCTADYITIEGSSNACTRRNTPLTNKYCGEILSTFKDGVESVPVCDCTPPFEVSIKTDDKMDAKSATIYNRGVCLNYNQKPC